MRVLFSGRTRGNNGPANANRMLVENWPVRDEIVVLRSSSKVGKVIEGLWKGKRCDILLSPGGGVVDIALHALLGATGMPTVCFSHGYTPYENVINHLGYSRRRISAIEWHMRTADAIVANSEYQMRFVQSHLEGCSGLYDFANLGIEPFKQASVTRANDRPVIAVSGGTRPIKANEVVVRAVRILRSRGINCELRVYGRDYVENEELAAAFESGEAKFMGQMSQDEFVRQLGEADVFVMDSRHEPFGLSAFDSIRAGCSLLLSRNCGVAGVLALEDEDVVENCEDAVEVADKVEGLLVCPNAERLYRALDFDALSWNRAAMKLRDVCVLVATTRRETTS